MTKHARLMALAALALGPVFGNYAATVSLDEAKAIAAEFVGSRNGKQNGHTLQPVFTAVSAGQPLYYVFNVDNNAGFVMISAEASTAPVLGYSFDGGYPVDELPEPMKWMMTGIEKELKAAPTLQSSYSKAELTGQARRAASRAASSEKLLSTPNWSQEAPFNSLIPGKPLVGCVGTAMATVMKYYNWPASGSGSFGDVDFNVEYDWNSMRADNYRSGYTAEEGEAVATLMYHASKSIDTQYAMSGSSAYEVRVPGALSSNFGYDPGVSYKKRSEVASQQAWDEMVKNEIDEGRPVIYCGQDVTAGHAFVCDGYQGEYLHFNWGWGGSANGYFLSTALNPTVSRTHSYNNLNTIIYNIKPAADASLAWSPIHITTDGNQSGIGSDMTDLASGESFTVRVGNLKNLSFSDFNGKIAVALFGADGKMKALLSNPVNFTMQSMGYLFNGYTDFRNCTLPDGTEVDPNDKVRIATLANGEAEWLPVAGELPTVNELAVNVASPASFSVVLPSGIEGVTIEGATEVIRGWNYSFRVVPSNSDEDVVTVKANGFVLTPDANFVYTIANVCEDQRVTVMIQKASEVVAKRSLWVETPGTLASLLSETDAANVKELTLFGSIDARDFQFMRTAMRLNRLDISGVYIAANGANQANALPREAFLGLGQLREVILPKSLNRINNGAFRQCGITTITIPANVKTYEYNVFVGATALRDIYVGREAAEFINWCVLSGVKVDLVTLHVPNERAWANYNKAENWNTIKNIIVDPIQSNDDSALFAVMNDASVKFETENELGSVALGTKVSFTAELTKDTDDRMDVYANNTLLKPNAEGVYETVINANTIIHFGMTAPISTVNNGKSQWTLTDRNGSIGLLTDAVNVLPGQDFTIRANAINIPQGMDQLFWAAALTDSEGNIKEFISPVVLWNAGAGDNFKMNINCRVNDSQVREGNQIRLVTSANNKKTWQVVKGSNDNIVAAIPAVNNMNEVYNINLTTKGNANVSGLPETAVRGRDITVQITPSTPSHRMDLKINGETVVQGSASINHTFVAMQDMDLDLKVYDPKQEGEVTFNVKPGELYKAVTAQTIMPNVTVVGEVYSKDLALAFRQDFAAKTIKKLDLSGVTIVADVLTPSSDDDKIANYIPANLLYNPSGIGSVMPVVEEIILPNTVTRIGEGAFAKCANLKEITLPEALTPGVIRVTTASGGWKNGYSLGANVFDGCTSLTTIYIPGALGKDGSGRDVVCHFNPYSSAYDIWGWPNPAPYHIGHTPEQAAKVTVVVPQEYINVYRAGYSDYQYGNPWKAIGYNILSENPVYGLTYDPSRIQPVSEDVDVEKMASFLGENVSLESVKAEGKLRLVNTDIACLVYDNGQLITPNADGTIDVEFFNPAKNAEAAGNHNLQVIYTHEIAFSKSSDLFNIVDTQVVNENNVEASFDETDPVKSVLKNVAENSTVSFRVDFADNNEGLEARVMLGQQELAAEEDGSYIVNVTNASRDIQIFAVPTNGVTLNEEELAALNPEESAAVTSIALEGEISEEGLALVVECFPELETLDLSGFEGALPENAFAGMENLTTVTLPETDEIPANMFAGCTSLQSVDIPASVNSIGEGAFKDCATLQKIQLTGISSIGDNAFSGCENLMNITLLADVAHASEATERPARAARRVAVASKAFDGLNPNCFVILDQGVDVNANGVNFLRTSVGTVSETMPDGTVEEREGRIYTAENDIHISSDAALAIPHAFTLADNATISMETSHKDWSSLVVPFDVETITDAATGAALEITQLAPKTRMAKGNLLYTLAENGEALESVTEVKANVPYFFHTAEETNVVFSAKDVKVAATPAQISVEGKEFTLHATYAPVEISADQVYLLRADGAAFDPVASDEETVAIRPFEVYATSPAALSYIETELPYTDISTELAEAILGENGLKVAKEGSLLAVYAAEEMTLTLYTVDGAAVMTLDLLPGRNTVDLAPGLYILNGLKFRF